MSLLKKFLTINFALVLFLFGYIFYNQNISNLKTEKQLKGDVLAATTDNFDAFALATINQYPVVNYPDGKTVPLQDRFSIIRKYSSPTKFTNHLCNTVNEASAAWKNDTLGCTGYTQKNPLFIKLNFDGSEKLMLYNFYGLYSVDSTTNIVKWQSAHIDRFQNATATYNCGWTFDPLTVIPVKSGNNFYLFSKFNGLNNSNCLQFFDKFTNKPSYSQANGRLYLGYEVAPSGELDLSSYSRTTNLTIGGPFGPGPKNATFYITTPKADIYGCSSFDSSKRCTGIQGLALHNVSSAPVRIVNTTCKAWGSPVQVWLKCTYTCDPMSCNWGLVGCKPSSGNYPGCPSNKNLYGDSYICMSRAEPTNEWYTPCNGWNTATVPGSGYFRTAVGIPSFSNFGNFLANSVVWSTNTPAVPVDYPKYVDEASTNSTSNALNFTKDLNSKVFTTNLYMYKVDILAGKLNIKRYPINTSTYQIGGSSYISASNFNLDLPVGNLANTKFALQYNQNDIYLLATSGTTFKLYRIENLNASSGTVTSYDLSQEISTKITTGVPTAMGIVSSKIYLVVGNQVYFATISGTGGTVVSDANYGNVEVYGNVFTKTDLTDKFLVTNPSKKLEGNYLTKADVASSLIKSSKGVSFGFNYVSPLPTTLFNFVNYTSSLNKFNLLVNSAQTANDPNPLASASYLSISPSSSNNFEIITISQGKGIKIDLTNANLANANFKFDKYIFINLDPSNKSRISFYVDCSLATYSTICSGAKFYAKGAFFGQFIVDGQVKSTMTNSRFINITENPDLMLNLIPELRSKKYQLVSKTKVNLKYSN